MTRPSKKRRPRGTRRGRIDWIDGKPIVDEATAGICRRHKSRPGDIFGGEMMECLICGQRQRSDPRVETQWRAMRVDAQTTYYFCPAEFPADEIGTRDLFALAYRRVFLAALLVRDGKALHQGPQAEVFERVDWEWEASEP